ncbi:hypothetical protein DPX16_16835 [Anabarilius grahami]|uniref:Uncharacterized protein n=1 Tax=Anabarilius grahami TaxID=495550 RepID=A0A3N0YT94_ANAGA|nr:hypothetical protein DPX16_16835 [Anabarilius grahami]
MNNLFGTISNMLRQPWRNQSHSRQEPKPVKKLSLILPCHSLNSSRRDVRLRQRQESKTLRWCGSTEHTSSTECAAPLSHSLNSSRRDVRLRQRQESKTLRWCGSTGCHGEVSDLAALKKKNCPTDPSINGQSDRPLVLQCWRTIIDREQLLPQALL